MEGRCAAARIHVDAGLAGLDEQDPLYTPQLLTTGLRAEADLAQQARRQHRPADVEEACARAAALGDRVDAIARGTAGTATPPEALAHQALADAELSRARGTSVARLWAAAAGRFEQLGLPHPAAYARVRQAEAILAAGGERRETEPLLEAVMRTASALGAVPLHDLARAASAGAGAYGAVIWQTAAE